MQRRSSDKKMRRTVHGDKQLLYPFLEGYMRVLAFPAYDVNQYKTAQPNIIHMVLYRSLLWPANQGQGGDRKQRENLAKLIDLFEMIQEKFSIEIRDPNTGALVLSEQSRLHPGGGQITLDEEKLFDLLKSCLAKFVSESGAGVKDTLAADKFLDDVPLVQK